MVTVFVCGRRADAAKCSSCREPTKVVCEFELFGHKTGQKCGRAICREHTLKKRPGSETDGKPMCRTHHNMVLANSEPAHE